MGLIPQIAMLAAGIDRGTRHPDAVDFDSADPRNLIYARPPERGKIFVSSKMEGDALRAERRAAIEAIQEFPLADPWAWEGSAAAGPYCSQLECVAQAGTSDGLVLILAEEITPITLSELNAARAAGVPIFVMLKTGVTRDVDLERLVNESAAKAIRPSTSPRLGSSRRASRRRCTPAR